MRYWYTATQPWLFPPLYMMERFARVHNIVIMDEAQFDRHHVRVKLYLGGREHTFTPQVLGSKRAPFRELTIAAGDLSDTLAKAAILNYRNCPGYKEVEESWWSLLQALTIAGENLHTACMMSLAWLLQQADLSTNVHPSQLIIGKRPDDPSEWIAKLGYELRCTDYMQGRNGSTYLDKSKFDAREISVWCQSWFVRTDGELSTLDLLFRHGRAALRDAINCKVGKGFDNCSVERMW